MDIAVFENKIKVKIHGPNIEIEDADVNFTAEFTDEKEVNSCKLRIYNLNEENSNAVLNSTQYVEIFTNQYGLKDTDNNILWQLAFAGIPREATKGKTSSKKSSKSKMKIPAPNITLTANEPDHYIEIDLQEGDGKDIGVFISKSYRKGFNVKKILRDLAKSIDMEIVFDPNVQDFYVNYPIILHENTRDALAKVASYINAKCSISNNRVYIVSENPEGTAIYYQFDESNIPQPKFLQNKKIEFHIPYMSAIRIGSFVKLINKKLGIDGVYPVCKLTSSFSNHSEECETIVNVKY